MNRRKRIKRYFTKGKQYPCLVCGKPLDKRVKEISIYSIFETHKERFNEKKVSKTKLQKDQKFCNVCGKKFNSKIRLNGLFMTIKLVEGVF